MGRLGTWGEWHYWGDYRPECERVAMARLVVNEHALLEDLEDNLTYRLIKREKDFNADHAKTESLHNRLPPQDLAMEPRKTGRKNSRKE